MLHEELLIGIILVWSGVFYGVSYPLGPILAQSLKSPMRLTQKAILIEYIPKRNFVHLPKNIRNDYLFGECVQETFFFVTLYFNSFSWISNIELLELLRAMHILEFMYKSFSSWHSAETAVYSICYYPSSIQRSIDGGLRQPPIMPLNGAPFRKSGRFSNFHQHAEFLPWSQFIAQVEEYVSHIRYVV